MKKGDVMKRYNRAISYYISLTIIFLLMVIILPANKVASKEYHLQPFQYHVLLFVVVLPLVAIWFAAFYGYAKLKQYASSIHNTAEGVDFEQLASGTMWLAWGLPIPSIISLLLNSIANSHPGFHATDIIIANYVSLLIPLVAFSFISDGTQSLIEHAKLVVSGTATKLLILLFVILGVFYCFLTFRHLDLRTTNSVSNPYYLPTWLMILTITIPYLYVWFVGLLSAYQLALFGKQARGVLYRKPLQVLAAGVVAVIASSIALQYFTSVEPRAAHLSLDYQLATTYLIRIGAAIGYVLIAIGAIRLKKIEDV